MSKQMNLPKKYAPLIFGTIMSALMSLVMSFAMTAVNVGFRPHFLTLWSEGFLIGFLVATPVSFGAVPIAERAVHWLTTDNRLSDPSDVNV